MRSVVRSQFATLLTHSTVSNNVIVSIIWFFHHAAAAGAGYVIVWKCTCVCGILFLFWFKHDMRLRLRFPHGKWEKENCWNRKRELRLEKWNCYMFGCFSSICYFIFLGLFFTLSRSLSLTLVYSFAIRSICPIRDVYWKTIYAHGSMFFKTALTSTTTRFFLYIHYVWMVVCFCIHVAIVVCQFTWPTILV